MSNQPARLSIRDLLTCEENYIIPMYQRNYAWDDGEITQLIQDVVDYRDYRPEQNYYIGTLVVARKKNSPPVTYEIIDGQQRLTTLSLLASFLKNETSGDFAWYRRLNIRFQSREHSHKTLAAAFEGELKGYQSGALKANDTNSAILNGYRLIQKILPRRLREAKKSTTGQEFADFANYLFNKVQIIRVEVPEDTDLNHYFEIMNSRGEQLEKHELIKATLLAVFNTLEEPEQAECKNCLHAVWEACANMEKYVQMGFTTVRRTAIFGADGSELKVNNFEELRNELRKASNAGEDADSDRGVWRSLDDIIAKGGAKESKPKEDESPERFNTVINFPNFLLHVLRMQCEAEDIPLDDKRLIRAFEDRIRDHRGGAIEFVKEFTFNLLRCKYLFDRYVIKREFMTDKDRWSLKRFKQSDIGSASYANTFEKVDGSDGDNRRILMLLAAFHVSSPAVVYKHWLNAALHWLFTQRFIKEEPIQAADYLQHLESVARAFVFDQSLASGNEADYFEMIYKRKAVCQAKRESDCDWARLSFEKIENLVFNYLDYLLWVANERDENKDPKISAFEFTFRSSVEHYYPQNPLADLAPLRPETLDSFGNLCLISHNKNSRLSNLTPVAKRDYYSGRNSPIDSVKQHLMMTKYERWDAVSIAEHYKAIKDVLVESLEAGIEER